MLSFFKTKRMLKEQVKMELDYFHRQERVNHLKKKIASEGYLSNAVDATAELMIDEAVKNV